jgi:hypothetical protein
MCDAIKYQSCKAFIVLTASHCCRRYNTKGRGYPDVSLLGKGYLTILNAKQYSVSGTSASAVIFSGYCEYFEP